MFKKYNQAIKQININVREDLKIRSKTVFWCKCCQVHLCIGPEGNNRFEIYHKKVEY
jgi:hypothetical protein